MNLRFLLVPLIALLSAGLLIWWYVQPTMLGPVLGVGTVIFLFTAQRLDRTRSDWWRFAILPVIWLTSVLFFSTLVSGPFSMPALLALAFIGIVAYWRCADLYTTASARYRPFSLERLSGLLNFLGIFFFAAAVYGAKTFLDVPTWLVVLCFSIFVCLTLYQWVWITKLDWRKSWRWPVTAAIVMIELFFLVLSFPLDFRIMGFFVAVVYYAVLSLINQRLAQDMPAKSFRLAFVLIIIVWLAVLVTARWF